MDGSEIYRGADKLIETQTYEEWEGTENTGDEGDDVQSKHSREGQREEGSETNRKIDGK